MSFDIQQFLILYNQICLFFFLLQLNIYRNAFSFAFIGEVSPSTCLYIMYLYIFFQPLWFSALHPLWFTPMVLQGGTRSMSDGCWLEWRVMKTLSGLMTFEHYLRGCKWEFKKSCPQRYPSASQRIWLIEFKPYVGAALPRATCSEAVGMRFFQILGAPQEEQVNLEGNSFLLSLQRFGLCCASSNGNHSWKFTELITRGAVSKEQSQLIVLKWKMVHTLKATGRLLLLIFSRCLWAHTWETTIASPWWALQWFQDLRSYF